MVRTVLLVNILLCGLVTPIQGCSRKPRPNRDTTKPHLSCPGDVWKTAGYLQTSMTIYWTEPTAYDSRDGKLSVRRSGPGPGSSFTEGTTTIHYTATDNSGNYRSCHVSIHVQVIRCKKFGSLSNGWKRCRPSSDMIYGASCGFECYDGYKLQGDSLVECQKSGQWTNERQPYCQKQTCPRLRSTDSRMRIGCTDSNNYRSMCTYSCEEGYGIPAGYSRTRVCSAYGYWKGRAPVCKDIQSPRIDNCARDMTFYAERNSTRAQVWWDGPKVSDNSGHALLRQVTGPHPGATLDVGQYTIMYTATDEEKNKVSCEFDIIVKQILCPIIHPLPYTMVHCPNARRYGSDCTFGCEKHSDLSGQSRTECESMGQGHLYGQWSFGSHQPYCKLTKKCPDLLPPNNGALACDTWLGGRFCHAFCREGYSFNTKTGYAYRHSLLICGDSGRWMPIEDIPNCVKVTRLRRSTIRVRAVYSYDGPCQLVKDQIKRNFFSLFTQQRGCQAHESCSLRSVKVTCGISSSRLRRGTNETRYELTISARVEISPTSQDVIPEIIQERQILREFLQILPINDTALSYENIEISAPELKCPEGFEPNNDDYNCAECSSGSYHESQSNECRPCVLGKYQPESQKTYCLSCPVGTTTVKEGSSNETDCLDACVAGFFSDNGVEPCQPCDQGYFSTDNGSRTCTECPGSQISPFGATSIHDCYDFDIRLHHKDTVEVPLPVPVTGEKETFIIAFWVHCSLCKDIVTITQYERRVLALRQEHKLTVEVDGMKYATGYVLNSKSKWYFIHININSTFMTVRVNNDVTILQNMSEKQPLQGNSTFNITIGGDEFYGSIFNLNLWALDTYDETTHEYRCTSMKTGNILSWRQFSDIPGHAVRIRSRCDDYDNCLSGPCKHNGSCSDGFSTYICHCLDGYTGDSCETNIDDCEGHACDNNATCLDGVAEYTCLCLDGFKGPLCEIQVVDGGWTQWSEYGQCSSTCGNGTYSRIRVCEYPAPENGGKTCDGEGMQVSDCETGIGCIYECDTDPRVENGTANCTWYNSSRVCYPYCNKGFDFDSDLFLHEVVCDVETGHIWNIKTEENPTGQLPTCKEIKQAETNVLYYTGQYTDLDISSVYDETSESVLKRILVRVEGNVNLTGCVQRGRCDLQKTDVFASGLVERIKRETPFVGFTTSISCDIIGDTEECFYLLKEVKELLDELVDQRNFSVVVSSVIYNVDMNSTSFDGMSKCEAGTVPVIYYCVPCGPGMYQLENFCEMCPKATYQDENGQTSCKACPDNLTTDGLMSRNVTSCKDRSPKEVGLIGENISERDIVLIVMAIVVPVSIVILFTGIYHLRRLLVRAGNQMSDFTQALNFTLTAMTTGKNMQGPKHEMSSNTVEATAQSG